MIEEVERIMQRIILRAVLVGLVAGLIAGVYHNIVTVPVIERAIVIEEERSAAALPAGAQPDDEPPLVSLGMQRVGMAIGTGIIGAVFGLVFAAAYGLLRLALPESRPAAMAITAGLLGFWAISFLVSVKYPFVPPGVGAEETLLSRQGFHLLFYALSALGVAGLILALYEIKGSIGSEATRQRLYALAGLGYVVFLLLIFWLVPGNPDEVPVPADLLLEFNNVSLIGHLLVWGLMAVGFAYLLRKDQLSGQE
ncbi:MAG: CbtA family protein [Dehalococcoidia bacterium]|nr:CbtA family protein [Dehalococcoidia bacterium]